MKSTTPAFVPLLVGLAASLFVSPLLAGPPTTPHNIDVSQLSNNESEETIAVNPTNPNNIVIVTNVVVPAAGMFAAVSFDGGITWATRIIANNDNLGAACCDPSLSFDEFGNLFLAYLFNVGNTVPVALSTDGGLSFKPIANIAKPASSKTQTSNERRGLFRFVDQPTITAANGEVMQVCTLTESGQGGGRIYVNVDPDGLGPNGFGDHSIFVVDTHVGGFDFIPAQPDRSVDAEPGLAWDRTGGPHNGRVYLVYTLEQKNESDNTDIYVRYSDDVGATWSAGVRVNDDDTKNSQFLPKISLDPTSGNIAVIWYDARNDLGTGGAGDTDGIPNTGAQVWGAFSTDGGQTFTKNIQISAGTSNSHDAQNGIDYGDYSGLSFYDGIAHPAWSDNSNSTGNNPDGTLHQLDIYTASVPVR